MVEGRPDDVVFGVMTNDAVCRDKGDKGTTDQHDHQVDTEDGGHVAGLGHLVGNQRHVDREAQKHRHRKRHALATVDRKFENDDVDEPEKNDRSYNGYHMEQHSSLQCY